MSAYIDVDRFRVRPGTKVKLADIDTGDKGGHSKAELDEIIAARNGRLEELQELLWAGQQRRVLFVLQATDTGGKDGTIRHVFDRTNPQGVKVASFKRPTEPELARDYLWRVHSQVPANGEIVIFNRSHYEDVLVVRVNDLVPKERWSRRFDHINAFERLLHDEGTTIVKVFLHISKEEQRKRLQARLDEPHKNWKFAAGDLEERKHWDDYQEAFEDVLAKTSTDWAPWYVVPADSKRFRNLVVTQLLVDTLEGLAMTWPEPAAGLEGLTVE